MTYYVKFGKIELGRLKFRRCLIWQKNEKVDRSKHLMTTEDHVKGICEKVNIDHKKALIAAKMHDAGHASQERDK